MKRVRAILPLLLALALAPGCGTPIGANQVPVSRAYRAPRQNALDGGRYSDATRALLHRYDLEKEFRANPMKGLRRLHEKARAEEQPDLLLALAELHYFHANHLRRSVKPGESREARDCFLASSVYAYYYLQSELSAPQPRLFGPRQELARDIYNRALAQGFLAPGRTNTVVLLREGTRQLTCGAVEVRVDTNAFPWPLGLFSEFVMADTYEVKGLSVRNRQAGFGAPLIAIVAREAGDRAPPRMAVTAFFRVEESLKEWSAGRVKGSLEIHPGYSGSRVEIAGRSVPLEVDGTAPLAYALNNRALWRLGRQQFFSSREIFKSGIYCPQPYRAGAIPVVFVHGTFSSPIYWAEMWNTLGSDPVLSRRCQFWAYLYNSGNPVVWSAANFRDALNDTVRKLDPEGKDPALRQIVVIGHSQGGLLAKLVATRTEDKLWRLVSDKNLEDLPVTEDARAQLRRTLFVEPVVSVKRVVFVATPHRGSFRATGFARKLAAGVVALPRDLVRYAREQPQIGGEKDLSPILRGRLPTSLDGMSPHNPAQLTLAELPPVAGVTSHSIIAAKGSRPVEKDNDGVVTYQSAHVGYAASELVVRARHSCQKEPAVIEEVRRILLQHLAEIDTHRD